jgi:two-component system, response regulator RegA
MKNLLIVDDDKLFREVLGQSLGKRQFEVSLAGNVAEAVEIAKTLMPEYAVIDLKMPGESGLTLITKLLEIDPYTRIVVLTGYAGVATAVEAIKLGAIHYLAKPVDTDDIIAAFDKSEGDPEVPIAEDNLHFTDLKWRHIHTSLERNQGNISATARMLGMHRRTLQRIIDKMPRQFK